MAEVESIKTLDKVELKKKILMVGNTEMSVFGAREEVVKALVNEGYDVTVAFAKSVFGDGEASSKRIGCKFIETKLEGHGTNPLSELKVLLSYYKLLGQVKPDAVLTYTIKPNIYMGFACSLRKIPYLVNITGLGTALEGKGKLQSFNLMLYKLAMKNVSCIFFQNSHNRQFFLDNGVIKEEKTVLLPGSGVNLSKYVAKDYPEGDKVKFLFASRIMKRKGIDEFLEAAKYIKEKYPDTEFHIAGNIEEPEYEEVFRKAQEDGLALYHGHSSDMRPYYGMCSCTVLPSYYPEGMSNVLLESSASARPCITTDRSGCKEAVDDGVTGYICKQQDVQSLKECMEKFMLLSPEERKNMGLSARNKVEREFDRRIVVEKYISKVAIETKSVQNQNV